MSSRIYDNFSTFYFIKRLYHHFLSILILIKNFYLVEKQKNKNVMEFFRSFLDSKFLEICDEFVTSPL